VIEGPGDTAVVARSGPMAELMALVERLAAATAPVLLEGESGTGKDLVAHLLHYRGPRRDGPFIKVHCPSIPEELMESELLGHEKGAFTDARQPKAGKLEMAMGGTLYFDQVQDLSPRLQPKLLRVVEEKAFERLGSNRTISVDVRFLASSNVALREAVARGSFREDLYHRLSVVPLTVPPLRERREDVMPLAERFLERERDRGTTGARRFDAPVGRALRAYHWPGNVRELRSVVERAALLTGGAEVVTSAALPPSVVDRPAAMWENRERHPTLKEVEEAYIRHILERLKGSQTRAAAVLGISRKALWEKRRRFGIS